MILTSETHKTLNVINNSVIKNITITNRSIYLKLHFINNNQNTVNKRVINKNTKY